MLGIISEDFDINDKLLIGYYFIFARHWRKTVDVMGQYISYF
jgi:hypothetical protein